MSTLLDRYERDAVILPFRNAGAHEDLVAQAVEETRNWKQIQQNIEMGGDPTALLGFAGLEFDPEIKDAATVTGSATEQALLPLARTAIPAASAAGNALSVRSPKLYRLFAWGTSTTAATPGTYTLISRLGNANTSPAFGVVSGALTPVASATAAHWRCFGLAFIRAIGTAGTATASFEMNHSGTIGGGGPVSATGNAVFGGIATAIDYTATTNSLWIGVTHATSTTNTWVPQFVGWGSWS